MSLPAYLKALYGNQYRPKNLRQIVYPVTGLGGGAGVGVVATAGGAVTWGVWVDVVISATIATDSLVTHVYLDTPSGGEVFAIQIGCSTIYANAAAVIAAGVGAVLAAARSEVRCEVATDAGWSAVIPLPVPVFIPSGQGIIARISTVGGGTTMGVAAGVLQNFE